MKNCSKCKTEKSKAEFSKNRSTEDGLKHQCKTCIAEYYQSSREEIRQKHKVYYLSNKKEIFQQQSEYNQTPDGRDSQHKGSREQWLKFPEKHKARQAVNNAIRDGRLTRPPICESCFREKLVHGHHADYDKHLDVDWLCIKCHTELHKELLLVIGR